MIDFNELNRTDAIKIVDDNKMADANKIAENIKSLYDKIAECAVQSNRTPDEITLIGVSKFFPANYAEAAVKAGLNNLGENRVAELIEKREILLSHGCNPNWHLIGTLQRKKVKLVIGKAALIHSVDSTELLQEISKRSKEQGIVSPVLLQVNISHEKTKHGFDSNDVIAELDQRSLYPGVEICGLMTMAPLTQDSKIQEDVFYKTRELFEKMKAGADLPSFRILSMGMSNDYPAAIRNGATHLRIGTAIFGHRT